MVTLVFQQSLTGKPSSPSIAKVLKAIAMCCFLTLPSAFASSATDLAADASFKNTNYREWLIEPGSGIGPLKLHSRPTESTQFWLKKNQQKIGIRLLNLGSGGLQLIEVMAPFPGKTKRGLGIGTDLNTVSKAFPEGVRFSASDNEYYLVAAAKGIGFVFSKKDKEPIVRKVAVFSWQNIGFAENTRSPATQELTVYPGTGIADLVIGSSQVKDANKRLGSADLIEPSKLKKDGKPLVHYVYPKLGIALDIAGDERNIDWITLFAPFKGRTTTDIGIGSSIEDVQKAFGERQVDYVYLSYPELGIEFALNGGAVMAIFVHEVVEAETEKLL